MSLFQNTNVQFSSVYMQQTLIPKDCFQSPLTVPRTVPDNTGKHKQEKKFKLTNSFE